MKIGITCYPVYGGSGVVATELGIELARRGHEIHFISYAQPFRLPHFVENVYYHEVDVPSYPLFEYPPYSLALAVALPAAPGFAAQRRTITVVGGRDQTLHVQLSKLETAGTATAPSAERAARAGFASGMHRDPRLPQRAAADTTPATQAAACCRARGSGPRRGS